MTDSAPPRRGVVSPSPWQLVEVSKQAAVSALSKPNSPNIALLRTPPTQPAASPTAGREESEERLPSAACDWEGAGGSRSSWWEASRGAGLYDDDPAGFPPKEEDDEGGFDAMYLVGDWLDTLGHRIWVEPSGPRGRKAAGGKRRGRGRRGRDREREEAAEGPAVGDNAIGFLAVMYKPEAPEKRFTIAKDRGGDEWTCGNGKLVRDESGPEVLVWMASDGRKSRWTRSPPEGPVYFDAPPTLQEMQQDYTMTDGQGCQACWAATDMHGEMAEGQQVFYIMSPEEVAQMQAGGEGMQWQIVEEATTMGAEGPVECAQEGAVAPQMAAEQPAPQAAPEAAEATEVGVAAAAAAAASAAACFGVGSWNPEAPEFVPCQPSAAAVAPAAPAAVPAAAPATAPSTLAQTSRAGLSPMQKPWASPRLMPAAGGMQPRRSWGRTPTPSPKMQPVPSPKLSALMGALTAGMAPLAAIPQKLPITVELVGETPDLVADGPRLEWHVDDNWGKLSNYSKGHCKTSPIFGVRRAANMQLWFFPNGSRTAEEGHCTVALERGPDSAGIKFEFLVNGRGIGPKVCLGRRYLGDYPIPFDGSEEHKSKTVVVCMQVLEILGDD